MLDISVFAGYFGKARPTDPARGYFDCADIARRAGFKLMDVGAAGLVGKAEHIKEKLAEMGMKLNQTHSPYNRYTRKDYAEFAETIKECAKSACLAGADYFVVHGDEFDFANDEYTPEKALKFNHELYAPVVDICASNGVKVAFETVFEDMNKPRFCSETEDLLALVDSYNTDSVGICWDFGHAKVQHPKEHLDKFESVVDRVICTHIHDNVYKKDIHSFPFLGDTDWERAMSILKNGNYKGILTFEHVYGAIPAALVDDYANILYKTACILRDMCE